MPDMENNTAPEVNQEATPEKTPEVNQEATPEKTPEVNQEATPEKTPEANHLEELENLRKYKEAQEKAKADADEAKRRATLSEYQRLEEDKQKAVKQAQELALKVEQLEVKNLVSSQGVPSELAPLFEGKSIKEAKAYLESKEFKKIKETLERASKVHEPTNSEPQGVADKGTKPTEPPKARRWEDLNPSNLGMIESLLSGLTL